MTMFMIYKTKVVMSDAKILKGFNKKSENYRQIEDLPTHINTIMKCLLLVMK